MITNFLLKKRTNPTPYSPISYFGKENNPSIQSRVFITLMKLLKAPNNLPHSNNLDVILKIETTTHGCVGMVHKW